MANKTQKEATRDAEDAIESILFDLEQNHGVRVFSFRVNQVDDGGPDSVTIIPDSNGGRY